MFAALPGIETISLQTVNCGERTSEVRLRVLGLIHRREKCKVCDSNASPAYNAGVFAIEVPHIATKADVVAVTKNYMRRVDMQVERYEILSSLSEGMRDAYIAARFDEFGHLFEELDESEQQGVRETLLKLERVPSEPVESLGEDEADSDSNDLEIAELSGRDELPENPFYSSAEEAADVIVPDQLELDAAHRAGGTPKLFPVWYATTRKPKNPLQECLGFGTQRSETDEVHYGIAQVAVPSYHRFGSLGSSFWWRFIT